MIKHRTFTSYIGLPPSMGLGNGMRRQNRDGEVAGSTRGQEK